MLCVHPKHVAWLALWGCLFPASPWLGAQSSSNQFLLSPAADTFINNTGGNHGNLTYLSVYNGSGVLTRTLIRFDLSPLGTNRVITNATLKLFAAPNWAFGNPSGQAMEIYRLTNAWDEATSTWQARTGTLNWAAADGGGDYVGTTGTRDQAPYAVNSTVVSNNYSLPLELDWNITGLAREWYSATQPNYGLLLGSYAGNLLAFNSREQGGSIPLLEIDSAGVLPGISLQPQSQTVLQGSNVTLTVGATGSPTLCYQWQFNGTNLGNSPFVGGTATSNLNLLQIQPASAGSYQVVITNALGAVTSSPATLTVLVLPTVQSQPTSQTNQAGSSASFSVQAGGTSPLSFQWFKNATWPLINNSHVSGATSSTLVLTQVLAADAGVYSLQVSNIAGVVVSSNATLSVIDPVITAPPVSLVTTSGLRAQFTIAAVGTLPISYQWLFNGHPLSDNGRIGGSASNLLVLSSSSAADAGAYSVLVSNSAGSQLSPAATLSVTPRVVLNPTADARIGNYLGTDGTSKALSVYNDGTQFQRSLLKFDLSAFATNEVITNVILKLYANSAFWPQGNSNGLPIEVYRVTAPWDETAVTWQQRTSTAFWSTYGGDFAGLTGQPNQSPYAVNSTVVPDNYSAPLELAWNVTSLAREWLGGAKSNCGLLLLSYPGAGLHFNSRENTNAVPALEIYSAGSTPVILSSPVDVIAPQGSNATFSVSVSGNPAPACYWQFNGTSLNDGLQIRGSTTTQLSISNLSLANEGLYQVVASNWLGVSTSAVARLSLLLPLSILAQPAAQTPPAGASVSFSVQVHGTPPVSYQWFKNITNALSDGAHVTGSATSNLTLAGVLGADSGVYSAQVSNVLGALSSSNAQLQVIDPAIIAQPVSLVTTAGMTARFSVAAAGTSPMRYWWRFNGAPLSDNARISGSTSSQLSIAGVAGADAGIYSLLISNPLGTLTSASASLSVTPRLQLNPVADARIGNYLPADGTNRALSVYDDGGTIQRTLLRFDLSALATNDVVTNAILKLYADSSFWPGGNPNGLPIEAYRLTSSWDEAAVTWQQRTGSAFWGTYGGDYAGTSGIPNQAPYATNSTLVQNNYTAPQELDWDITSLVREWHACPQTNFGLLLLAPAGVQLHFDARENLTNIPVLELYPGGQIPTLSAQPQDVLAPLGGAASFSVSAAGSAPLSFQWQQNGTNLVDNTLLSGSSSDTLHLTGLRPVDEGLYRVFVTNLFGVATSTAARLSLLLPPSILTQPTSQTQLAGAPASFIVQAHGTAPLSYQWYFNGQPLTDSGRLTGSASNWLTIANVSATDAGPYSVLITNALGSIVSSNAWLGVAPRLLLRPAADARIGNYFGADGTSKVLSVYDDGAGMQRALLRFDLPAVAPTNAITNAVLKLYGDSLFWGGGNSNGLPIEVYRLTSPWDEATVTWQLRSATAFWTTYGADYAGVTGIPNQAPYSANTTVVPDNYPSPLELDWDITGLVQDWAAGSHANNGLIVLAPPGVGLHFDSRENGANGPQLALLSLAPLPVPAAPAAPLKFTAVTLTPNNALQFQLSGDSNLSLRIDTSTNLQDWTPFTNLLGTNGLFQFSDPGAATLSRRFYRAVWAQ